MDKATHADLQAPKPMVREGTDRRSDKDGVAEEYTRKQREDIVRGLSACKGRVGGRMELPHGWALTAQRSFLA